MAKQKHQTTKKPRWGGTITKKRLYSQESLLKAIQAVKDKRMSFGGAARHFGVPKTTVVDRWSY